MHHRHADQSIAPQTRGATIHWAKLYDKLYLLQILTLGRWGKTWVMMLDQAGLKTGDRVLDVGCGPGSLTIKAKARVGQAGQAVGIDASPEMIAVAKEKAQRAGAEVDFRIEVVEKMPFTDQSFDVVISSLMMHHLPDDLKRQALDEIYRVLKPDGCLMITDFKRSETSAKKTVLPFLHHRSMPVGIQDLVPLLAESGFEQVTLSDTPVKMFGYLRAYARTLPR
ncbi:MAG: class I SAM-dependent methyltransferase [Chloroflexi bacterium]|nr:MAG: class I SAM-dependent methyltransferase [Chloroflexota bacterium]